jgi:polyisoprenoid-binding protein YceI
VNRMSHFRLHQLFILLAFSLFLSACVGGGIPGIAPAAGQSTSSNPRAAAAAGTTSFVIIPEESEARFILSEEFLGTPKTVLGATNQLNGELSVDPANPASNSISTIQVDARTFVTDNERRDVAVRRFILQSDRDEYQFITFTPAEITGLPENSNVGDELNFQVTGDLQIRDIVHAASFDVAVTVVSAKELTGVARAVIMRSDFELTIPQVPSVANVSEEVMLELDFTARTQ